MGSDETDPVLELPSSVLTLAFCLRTLFGTVTDVGICCRVTHFEMVENECSTFTIPWLLRTTTTNATAL